MIHFLLFDFAVRPSQYWLSICEVTCNRFSGALFHLEIDYGYWKFDLFFLRSLIYKLKERLSN